MGAWGTGLYSNDTAEDARTDFSDVFSVKPVEEATEFIIREYMKEIDADDLDELADFWYALADWQWNKGILQQQVKEKALSLLDQGAGLGLWEESASKSDIRKRKEVLENLRKKLHSPMPPKKKIRNSCIHYRIEPGDVIAVRPNERFSGSVKENGVRKALPFFTSEYIKYRLELNYATDKAPEDGVKPKKYRIFFKENYQPIINRESYFLMLCVKKERYYRQKWDLLGLYDESVEFVYYDYYSKDLTKVKEILPDLNFFKIVDPEDRELKFITTDWFSAFTLERYKKICHDDGELEKFKAIEDTVQKSGSRHFSYFLTSYELQKNPLIEYQVI